MEQTITTPELTVTIRLAEAEAEHKLTPKQQQEFAAQCSQADPQRILGIVQQTLQTLAKPEQN